MLCIISNNIYHDNTSCYIRNHIHTTTTTTTAAAATTATTATTTATITTNDNSNNKYNHDNDTSNNNYINKNHNTRQADSKRTAATCAPRAEAIGDRKIALHRAARRPRYYVIYYNVLNTM